MWYKFLMPLGPFFYLYAKKRKEKFSWLLYFFSSFMSIVLFYDVKFTVVLIAIMLVYSAYDIGYIYNNAETIKKERNPTLRFNESELKFYERYKVSIYFIKSITSISFAYVLCYFYGYSFSIWLFCIVMLIGFFYIYNSTRSVFNFYLQFLLSFLRFTLPLFILTNYDMMVLVISILIFPLPNFLERTKVKINNLPFIINDTALFRMLYYFVLFVFVIACTFLMKDLNWGWALFISGYFFSYRTVLYIIEKVTR